MVRVSESVYGWCWVILSIHSGPPPFKGQAESVSSMRLPSKTAAAVENRIANDQGWLSRRLTASARGDYPNSNASLCFREREIGAIERTNERRKLSADKNVLS